MEDTLMIAPMAVLILVAVVLVFRGLKRDPDDTGNRDEHSSPGSHLGD